MPKIVDPAQRREEITFALWLVIYERGIAGVSLHAVADAAGISVGRIQHYFDSKRELVLDGARRIAAMSEETWVAGDHDGSAEQLTALVRQPIPRTEAFRIGTAVWYAYLATAMADPELGEIVRGAERNGLDTATHLVADLLGLGASGGTQARETAVRLVALSNGLGQAVLAGVIDVDEAMNVLDREIGALTGMIPAQ